MHRLVLASQSPRRSELLERAGFEFTVTPLQISEIPDENLNLPDQIRDLAVKKADAWWASRKPSEREGNLVLSADTVVVFEGKILGKPKDRNENEQYLRRLSGRSHDVITAVCLVDGQTGERAVGHDISKVIFRKLNDEEIAAYIASGEGLDKAGGYGIQGAAGKFVEKLDGAFDTVMGLPIALVEKLLAEKNWEVARK